MAKNNVDLETRLEELNNERAKFEEVMLKEQDVLRQLDRQQDAPEYAAQLAKVNAAKQEIARVAVEQVEYARAVALVKGGRNHIPPLTPTV